MMKAFESAKSAKQMLKAFQKLEIRCDDENLLGMASCKLAKQLADEGGDPEKVLRYGKRALKTLIDTENLCSVVPLQPLLVASLLTILGQACCKLNRFDESLSYLNWSYRNLRKLELDESCPAELVLAELLATQIELFRVKVGMGRKEEVVVHAKKILEVKEKILGEDCMEVGMWYKIVSDCYMGAMKFKEALSFCLKAVEIHAKHLGQGSLEVARLRRNLVGLYFALGEYEKAIKQNQLALSVLKKETSCRADMIKAELENGYMLMELGRHQESVALLKGVVPNVDNESERATAFVAMARSLCSLEKYADADKYMKLALRLYDKKGLDPVHVATGLRQMAVLYMQMKDAKTAISLMKRVQTMFEIHHEKLKEYNTRHAEFSEVMRQEKAVEGHGPSEENKLDDTAALMKLVEDLVEKSPTTAAPQPRYNEDFAAKNAESIISKYRKPSSSR